MALWLERSSMTPIAPSRHAAGPKACEDYGVKVAGDSYAAALASLEAADDVTFVALANEVNVGTSAAAENPATNLMALKEHVESMSAQGQKRLGVAMVNPATPKAPAYVPTVATAVAPLKSDASRMVISRPGGLLRTRRRPLWQLLLAMNRIFQRYSSRSVGSQCRLQANTAPLKLQDCRKLRSIPSSIQH